MPKLTPAMAHLRWHTSNRLNIHSGGKQDIREGKTRSAQGSAAVAAAEITGASALCRKYRGKTGQGSSYVELLERQSMERIAKSYLKTLLENTTT